MSIAQDEPSKTGPSGDTRAVLARGRAAVRWVSTARDQWLSAGWLGRVSPIVSVTCVVAVSVLIWGWPGLKVPPVLVIDTDGAIRERAQTLYLLSAIAQSLAAVLALVFTISLVVAQLSSRYSHRLLADFFDPWTVGYILLFIAAVFMPFWLLAEPSSNAVRVSLSLAAVALLLLIPYFLRFREKLSLIHNSFPP